MAITNTVKTGKELYLAGSSASGVGGWGAGLLAGPASYATGGQAADFATDFGLTTEPDMVFCEVAQITSTRAYDCKWDSVAKKVIYYTAGTVTEAANTTDLSAQTCFFIWFSNEA